MQAAERGCLETVLGLDPCSYTKVLESAVGVLNFYHRSGSALPMKL